MIRANKELDLLRSYRRLMRGEKGRSGLLHHFLTPAAVCLLVCVLIWGVLLLRNSSLRRRTDDVNDWLRDPAVVEQYTEAADRQQYNDSLEQTLGQVQALTDALATYPQVDSALISRIGAAGGAEAVASVLALRDGITPPTIGLEVPDPDCDLDYAPLTARKDDFEVALSSSLGFGGHNACLAFRKVGGAEA